MVIDFHTHAFPEKIATKALNTLGETSGNIKPFHNGTITALAEYAENSEIDYCVLLNIATNTNQQSQVNDFAAQSNNGRIISFGSVYPYAENALDELDRIKEMGLKGIKLHPDYQKFYVDDESFFPIYEKAAKLGLITVFHAGLDIGLFEPVYGTPERIANAIPAFNGGVVVAAHFGGYMYWYDVEKYLIGKPIYLDTAFCYSRMPVLQAKRIVSKHGADKILFGSDMPWSNGVDEMRFVEAIAGSKEEKEMILGRNALRLLNI